MRAGRQAIRPEMEVLFSCARTRLDAPVVDRIRTAVRTNLDWELLVHAARRHQMMPLLYRNLTRACADAVPDQRLRQLRAYFHLNAHLSAVRTSELLRLATMFEEAAVAALPFKGPLLAACAYGSLSLREFSDLDFLVPEPAFARSAALLVADGYQFQTDFGWEAHFVKRSSGMCVDLHRTVLPAYFPDPFRFDDLWRRRQPLWVQGAALPSLSPEDLLLVLSAQWAKDCCNRRPRISQLCDGAELLRACPQLDWRGVVERASTSGVRRMLHLYVSIAGEVLGLGERVEFRRRFERNRVTDSLHAQAMEWLLRETDNHPETMEPGRPWTYPHSFHLRLRERLRDRLVYLTWRLKRLLHTTSTPNERDFETIRLPNSMRMLYYVIRPVRLLKTHTRILIGKLRARLRNPS